jgi:adenosylcobinamide-phosphate synthase
MEEAGAIAVIVISEALIIFLLAAALDIIFGEPPARIHPVVWIGNLISFLRARARPSRLQGALLAITVIITTVLIGHLLVRAAGIVPLFSILVAAYLLKSTFAMRCLLQMSSDIGKMIDRDMDGAKKMLPALVGRDTKGLTRAQATSAVIESLSENYVDSILSPIFYYVLFSPLGFGLEAALAFKAMSTMDSMLGYKTKGLKDLGYVPAHLDDLANYIPARLSIFIMALSRPTKAVDTLKAAFKYHGRTPSPNSGWPMSACAGTLGIRLDKPGFYVLLDEGREPDTSDVPLAIRFMVATIALTLAASVMVLYFV